ncbi:MAG: iron-sulfur cluster assembly scaffold protein [Promethearchaeota archaeon]
MSRDKFDEFVEKLQEEIMRQEIEEFNEHIVKLYHDPINWGRMDGLEATVSASYKGPCGDTMEFYLKIKDDLIEKASFFTDGCGATVAAGSQTTQMITNKPVSYAKSLTPKDIDEALNGLPDNHKHCAVLAINTLKKALEKYKKE